MIDDLDLSALSKHKPLLLGEAPVADELPPFAPWNRDHVPETTAEILDLAFGPTENRTKEQAESEYKKLHNAFDLANILPNKQPLIDEKDPEKGRQFDIEAATYIMKNELLLATTYNEQAGSPVPNLYGRTVIIFGRVGEALVRATEMLIGNASIGDFRKEICQTHKRLKYASHFIVALREHRSAVITMFIWVYHPSHIRRNQHITDPWLLTGISVKRARIRRILRAGLRGERPDCVDATPYRLVAPIRRSSKIAA